MTAFPTPRKPGWLNVVLAVAISGAPQITDPQPHMQTGLKMTTVANYQQIDGGMDGSDDLAYLEGDILFGRDERSHRVAPV